MKKATKKVAKKKVVSAETITMKALFIELGIDPKRARSKMRKEGMNAEGGRYPDVVPGSAEYEHIVGILS